jgi:hypothetical protein
MPGATLIEAARMMLERPEGSTLGLWPRAAALLARQAIEEALELHWSHVAPGLLGRPLRTQWTCLSSYLSDEAVVADGSFAWQALTRVCHHHHYELDPTAAELRHWIEMAERFVLAIEERHSPGAASV